MEERDRLGIFGAFFYRVGSYKAKTRAGITKSPCTRMGETGTGVDGVQKWVH